MRESGAPASRRLDRCVPHIMTATIGRLLQLIGMIVLPIGLSYGLLKDNIRVEMQLLALGGFLFALGWILSRKAN